MNADTGPTMDGGRDEIEDLLPWYANGRLSAADRRRVEAALARDDELARRLELAREEMEATIASNEALQPTSARAFDRLMAAIDADPRPARPAPAARVGLIDRFGEFLATLAPRRLAYAAAAAVVALAIQAAAIGGLTGRLDGPAYQTASQGAAQPERSGPSVLVAFAPGARIEDVAAFLKRHGVEGAEGPKANGFFRLRLAAGADAAKIAAAMQAETALIGFAQPAP